jgi:hypothetical protein
VKPLTVSWTRCSGASVACRSLSELTPWVKQLGFPIAPGVADFFTTQSNLDTVHDPGGWAALT